MKSTFLRMLGTAAICLLLTAAFSCKSKQATDTSDAERARMEQMEAERRAREEEEARRRAEEEARLAREREREAAETAAYSRLGRIFNEIATASSESAADRSINEALNMAASQNVPVLIMIYQDNQENVVDYDEPTTLSEYLHYLKVVKRKPDNVEKLEFNNNGKISEIVLKKNF